MTDEVRLNDEIKKSGLKKGWIAEKLGLSCYGFCRKVNNKNQFKAGEIKELCRLLEIASPKKMSEIFFADNVDKKATIKCRKEENDANERFWEGEKSYKQRRE